MYQDLEALNFRQTLLAVVACCRARLADGSHVVPMVIGDPGIGKSAMIKIIARILGLPATVLIASFCDPTDFAGLPVPDKKAGGLTRYPIEQIVACASSAGLLAHDEVTAAPLSVQGPLMRGILEGEYGSTRLHKESVQVALCNPSDQAPGGTDPAAPLRNRFAWFRLIPEVREVIAYLRGEAPDYTTELSAWDPERYEQDVQYALLDFAAICEIEPGLVQLTPPPNCVEGEQHNWASPRAIERGMHAWVAAKQIAPDDTEVHKAVLQGAWGSASTNMFLGYLDLHKELPTMAQVAENPSGCKLPESKAVQIAAISLLTRTARELDQWAAWIYCARLRDEIKTAVGFTLSKIPVNQKRDNKSPHAKAGQAVLRQLQPELVKQIMGV